MKKIIFLLFGILFANLCDGSIEHYLQKVENKIENDQVRNIDFVYLINLDLRPGKWTNCLSQLQPYNIVPHRFPAIYGWGLPVKAFNDCGLTFLPGMQCGHKAIHYSEQGNRLIYLDEKCYGKNYLSAHITPGALGCTLSHLSILQDALDSGYETIWLMEDDILVVDNPHLISNFIDQLDSLVGNDGWDILHTDHIAGCPWFIPRPDLPTPNLFTREVAHGKNFTQIGGRYHLHSMIIRQSGMKKILDFATTQKIFSPYDHELSYVPNLKMYILNQDLVTCTKYISDTIGQNFN